jgi:hypothetical protein
MTVMELRMGMIIVHMYLIQTSMIWMMIEWEMYAMMILIEMERKIWYE